MTEEQSLQELMAETDKNIEIATKALENATVTAKELGELMEERTPKIIHQTYELYDGDNAKAQKAVLEMGYSKEEIRQCGYEVD